MTENDRYGINMRRFCKAHEQYLIKAKEDGVPVNERLSWHLKKLSFLQHERLIHLIVLVMTVILNLFTLCILLFLPDTLPVSGPVFLALFILLAFYIRHYFFLENTTQHWYNLAEALHKEASL